MDIVIKEIVSDFFDLRNYAPDDPFEFFLTIRVRVGFSGDSAADDFELSVCTSRWIEANVFDPLWGHGLLIVRSYDFAVIHNAIKARVEKSVSGVWDDAVRDINKYLLWEFDGYVGDS